MPVFSAFQAPDLRLIRAERSGPRFRIVAEQELASIGGNPLRQPAAEFEMPERDHDEHPIPVQGALIHIELRAAGEVFAVIAEKQRVAAFSQRQGTPVEVQDAVRVVFLRRGVDLRIVLVDIKPRFRRGKARVGRVAPLHRRPRAVPAGDVDALHPLLLRLVFMEHVIEVFRRDVQILFDGMELDVGHADLLPLIDEGAALLEEVRGGQRRAALAPEAQRSVAADDAGMVMVLEVQRVPGFSGQSVLPAGEGALELSEGERVVQIFRQEAVGHHRVELDDHIQHPVLPADVAQRALHVRHGGFADLDRAVFPCDGAEFSEIAHDVRAVLVIGHAVDHRQPRQAVGQLFVLGDIGDDVLAEAVHAHVQPEPHDGPDLLADAGVVHVQVGLILREEMQVVLAALRAVLPGRPGKLAGPVVGQAVSAAPFEDRVAPDVIRAVGVVLPLPAFEKPGVLIGGMVDDKVEDHLQPQGVGARQHLLELLHRPVIRVDRFVVGDVVPEIRVGRGIDWAEPDGVHAQGTDIVELVIDAVEVADAVAVSVAEAAHPDLVNAHPAKIKLFHLSHLFRSSSISCRSCSASLWRNDSALSPASWMFSIMPTALSRKLSCSAVQICRRRSCSSMLFAASE